MRSEKKNAKQKKNPPAQGGRKMLLYVPRGKWRKKEDANKAPKTKPTFDEKNPALTKKKGAAKPNPEQLEAAPRKTIGPHTHIPIKPIEPHIPPPCDGLCDALRKSMHKRVIFHIYYITI